MVILHKHWLHLFDQGVWKLQKKVSFNIASEASYVFNLGGQKFIKDAKNGWRVFENLKITVKQCYQTCHFQKLVEHAQIENFKWDILDDL